MMMTMRHPRGVLSMSGVLAAALWPCNAAHAVTAVQLFDASSDHTGAIRLQLRNDGRLQVRNAVGTLRIEAFPLTQDVSVALKLQRFEVADSQTQFVLGQAQGGFQPLAFDPGRITLLRGAIEGRPGSHVFMAVSDLGVAGRFELGPGAAMYMLRGEDAGHGLARGALHVAEIQNFSAPPLVDPCRVEVIDGANALPSIAGSTPDRRRHIQLAIETDYEYYQLFGNADDAAAYIVALYGAVSDIYQRDLNARVQLTFVRLWDTPDDLFNQNDPLVPFRNHWNQNMGVITRDTAQFLTGRRNLPYGGVAYFPGLCGEFAYSVAGYILGSFVDPELPNAGNWDVIVTAHELGHNCGTLHTHDYGFDSCNVGGTQRGGIMSYCHTTPGGNANIDLSFRTELQELVISQLSTSDCISIDCNNNNSPDGLDILLGSSLDANGNGVPDECEDCNRNGILDPMEISSGASLDLNSNGVPDECEPDCNRNGVPDDLDIALGTSIDAYSDGIPDECQIDCNGNSIADYTEIQADMSLDVNRNAVLDSCEDCDDDGVTDLAELAGGMNLWLAGATQTFIKEFHGGSGAPVKSSTAGFIGLCNDVLIAPDRSILVSSAAGNKIARFDPISGVFLGDFVASGAGGLNVPFGMIFGPNGNLLVANSGAANVLEFDGSTGEFIREFASMTAGIFDPIGVAFGPDGHLYVSSGEHRVLKFDGATGASLGVFVDQGSGGLNQPRGLLFKPDGNLLVASFGSNAVLEYDGATGAFIARFDKGGLLSGFWGLQKPWTLRLNPRGDTVLVSANIGNAAVHSYDLATGLFQRWYYVLSQDLPGPTAFDVMPPAANDCNMNFVPDNCDIAAGTSADANNNGIPDECEPGVPGDITGDGLVDVQDLLAVINAWGACPAPPALCAADLDGDGQVGVTDLLLVINNWS